MFLRQSAQHTTRNHPSLDAIAAKTFHISVLRAITFFTIMMSRITSSTPSIFAIVSAAVLLVLNAATTALAQDIKLCRCTAKFERFYDRRSLMQKQRQEEGDHSLTFRIYPYDYKDYYVDVDGYYVVEGLRVLPDDDPACDNGSTYDNERTESDTAPAPYKRDGILATVFGPGRSLFEHDEEHRMDEDRPLHLRTLMGMTGGSDKTSSSSDPSDDYYKYGADGKYYKGHVRICCVLYPAYFAARLLLRNIILIIHRKHILMHCRATFQYFSGKGWDEGIRKRYG